MYVDGFVIPIKKKNLAAYRKMASTGAKIWKKHGALEYCECVGDDYKSMMGSVPFTKLAKVKTGETVVFSWIVFKSKAHRDAVNKKVMTDPAMSADMGKDFQMPFDMKRVAYSGFKPIVKY